MEIRDVTLKQADQRCPVCSNGWMRPINIVFTTNPPQYPHKCTACGYEATYTVRYPYVITQ